MAVSLTPYYSNRVANYLTLFHGNYAEVTEEGGLNCTYDPESRRETWYLSRIENDDIVRRGAARPPSLILCA